MIIAPSSLLEFDSVALEPFTTGKPCTQAALHEFGSSQKLTDDRLSKRRGKHDNLFRVFADKSDTPCGYLKTMSTCMKAMPTGMTVTEMKRGPRKARSSSMVVWSIVSICAEI